jgi:hypothetical protein
MRNLYILLYYADIFINEHVINTAMQEPLLIIWEQWFEPLLTRGLHNWAVNVTVNSATNYTLAPLFLYNV